MGKQIPDHVERAGVGRRIGRWRVTERRLIDANDFVDVFQATNTFVGAWRRGGSVQPPGQ